MPTKNRYGLFGEDPDYTARDLVASLNEKYGHRDFSYGFAGRIVKRYAEPLIELAIEKMPEQEPKEALAYLERLIQALIVRGLASVTIVHASNKEIDQEMNSILNELEGHDEQ